VNRLEILPFEDEHLEGAARLLAERHARHREAEPLLPADVDFAGEIEKERDDDLRGAVALDGDEVVGYLVGKRREDAVGPHVWSYVAGHAVREPELTRDLYAAAAAGWVEAGLTRHFAYVPNLPDLVDPWFRLSFGGSSALGTRETSPSPRPAVAGVEIRESTPDDVAAAATLDRLMAESMLPSPSFSYHEPDDEETVTEEWSDTWDHPETYRHFVAERDGRVVGHILLYRRPPDLRVPADSIDLAAASTPPEERGSGIGVALTHHVLTWAYEQGIPTMVTDWRLSNLLASRFWPKRGFRPTFLRVYRSIP
jgi:GNAT superfamily N-acetyltransferase